MRDDCFGDPRRIRIRRESRSELKALGMSLQKMQVHRVLCRADRGSTLGFMDVHNLQKEWSGGERMSWTEVVVRLTHRQCRLEDFQTPKQCGTRIRRLESWE
jgi:hypothetical protein